MCSYSLGMWLLVDMFAIKKEKKMSAINLSFTGSKHYKCSFFLAMKTLLIIEIRCRIFIKFKYSIKFFKAVFVVPSENELAEFKQKGLNNV